jgi:cell division protein FtsI/penicillin-binding protein 2
MRGALILFACATFVLVASLDLPHLNATAPGNPSSAPLSSNLLFRELLKRDFSQSDLSYIALDLQTDSLIASHWNGIEGAIPIGSLVKPFVAVAYAEAHGFRFPLHNCVAGTCWLPHGHGQLGIVRAVAMSCNSYFTNLAENVTAEQVIEVAHRFGLAGPQANATSAALAGRYGEWRESPLAVAHAYAELLSRSAQPGIAEIVAGMRESARAGTAGAISGAVPMLQVLAKTGTAPCTHSPRAPGDGFLVAAWPSDSPRYLLLLRRHGRPGALAAFTAGQILRELEAQR